MERVSVRSVSSYCEPSRDGWCQINYPLPALRAARDCEINRNKPHYCQETNKAYGALHLYVLLELRHHAQLPTLAQLVKPHERAEASGMHVCEPLVSAAVRAATLRDVELEPSLAARQ